MLGLVGVAAALALVFALGAYRLGVLTRSGAVAGGGLAFCVVGLGGWAWAVPSLLFFVSGSVLSLAFRGRKAEAAAISEKGSRRDAAQVLANGGVGWALLVCYVVHPADVWYAGFLGAFAAAAADTWATEVGTLSGRWPRLLTTGQRVPPGTSGAVTAVGMLGAVAGALVVWLGAWPFATASYVRLGGLEAGAAVVGAGLIGSLADSLAGATIQARFIDPTTGRATERAASPTGSNRLVRGWRWFRNDQVNTLCTLVGGAVGMACFAAADFAS